MEGHQSLQLGLLSHRHTPSYAYHTVPCDEGQRIGYCGWHVCSAQHQTDQFRQKGLDLNKVRIITPGGNVGHVETPPMQPRLPKVGWYCMGVSRCASHITAHFPLIWAVYLLSGKYPESSQVSHPVSG